MCGCEGRGERERETERERDEKNIHPTLHTYMYVHIIKPVYIYDCCDIVVSWSIVISA